MTQPMNIKQTVTELGYHNSSEMNNFFQNPENKKRIGLPGERGEIKFYEYHNIIRCESDNSYTTFFIKESNQISQKIISKGLCYYEKLLPKEQFLRTHSRHIVNISYVEKLFKGESAYFVMCDGKTVPIARDRKNDVLKALPNF